MPIRSPRHARFFSASVKSAMRCRGFVECVFGRFQARCGSGARNDDRTDLAGSSIAKWSTRPTIRAIPSLPPTEAVPRILLVDNQASDFLQCRIVLARTLREAGFDVHVALPPARSLEHISLQDIPVHIFYLRRKSTRLLDELRCWVSLFRLYRRLQPTLVHHIGLKPSLYGGIAARISGVPATINTLTGLGYLFTTETVKTRALRLIVAGGLHFSFGHRNQRVIFQNSHDRECLLASGIVSGDRAVLIKGSGVNLSLFTPEPESDEPPVVLMASRLLWTKGVAEFVAAARAVRARGIRARFVLAGEPDRGHPSAVPMRTLQLWHDAGDVEWLGWRHDMPAVLAGSHIVCLASSYGEGIPRILLEAAACGRAIVATDSPGCREVVRHGENGLLVPAGDGEALAAAIAQLIENAPLRNATGTRGREIAVTEFSMEQVINANLAMYRSLLLSAGLEIPRNQDLVRAHASGLCDRCTAVQL